MQFILANVWQCMEANFRPFDSCHRRIEELEKIKINCSFFHRFLHIRGQKPGKNMEKIHETLCVHTNFG